MYYVASYSIPLKNSQLCLHINSTAVEIANRHHPSLRYPNPRLPSLSDTGSASGTMPLAAEVASFTTMESSCTPKRKAAPRPLSEQLATSIETFTATRRTTMESVDTNSPATVVAPLLHLFSNRRYKHSPLRQCSTTPTDTTKDIFFPQHCASNERGL